ncbi:MAG: DNA polymerase III subunit [Patescibacteria group bacterium]|jgi:DNA polymerase III delta' subunit
MNHSETSINRWPVFGHTAIVSYLQQAVKKRQTVQAYLLHGPTQLGKATIARLFARSLLCTNENTQPCEECAGCQNTLNCTHPDFVELEKDPDQQNIGIEHIRDRVIKRLQLSSFLNTYKVAVINDAQYLSPEAANALLKTLEEPRQNVVIILIANGLSGLPSTVVSRCQTFEFFPLSTASIEKYIQKLHPKIKRNDLRTIAGLSRGRPGRAYELINKPSELERTIDTYKKYREVLTAPIWQRIKLLNEQVSGTSFQETKDQAEHLIQGLAVILRDEILRHYDLPGLATYFPENSQTIKYINAPISTDLMRLLMSLRRSLSQNASPRIILENFCLEY